MRGAASTVLALTLGALSCQSTPNGASSPPAPVTATAPSVASAEPAPPAEPASMNHDEIRIDVHVRHEWLELPSDRLPEGTQSAVAVPRAHDPATGEGYGALSDLGADPRHLVRGFVLERDTFLLGEPIVLEHVVKLAGPGTWQEALGGNYRARGRDDNFVVILVPRGGGAAVPDPFGEPRIGMGGISTKLKVERGKPQSVFVGAQPYSAITEPGRYDLYALRFADSHEALGWREAMVAALREKVGDRLKLGKEGNDLVGADGRPADEKVVPTWRNEGDRPSPIRLPAAVAAALSEPERHRVMDLTHRTITIRSGSAAERRAMVTRWRTIAEERRQMMQASRGDAAFKAIWYARQDDFLPVMEAWLKAGVEVPPQELVGLAMRPSRAATELLLEHGGPWGLSALGSLAEPQIPFAFPRVVEHLDDADDQARAYAFDALARWSGERFGATWDGFHSGRPTVEEARKMQPIVRAWWKDHQQGFVPKPR